MPYSAPGPAAPSGHIRAVVSLVESAKVRFTAGDDGMYVSDARGAQRLDESLADRVRWLIDLDMVRLTEPVNGR